MDHNLSSIEIEKRYFAPFFRVIVPADDYLERLADLCEENDVMLILDEIQTGFFRTGPLFASSPYKLKLDFLTMAKGIAGGCSFGAFAMSEGCARS